MDSETDEKLGTVRIADEVTAVCICDAVMGTDGVFSLSGGISESISKNLRVRSSSLKGIRVNQTEDGIVIDVHVNVRYGVKIPEVAWNIQENVKHEVEETIGEHVKSVNIHVQGVHSETGSNRE